MRPLSLEQLEAKGDAIRPLLGQDIKAILALEDLLDLATEALVLTKSVQTPSEQKA